jgi:hypothetical protein
MLSDPKSDRFVHDFVDQWLGVRDVGSVRPDRKMYRRFDDHLMESMRKEPAEFFRHVLDHDLSALAFLKSDFVVVNQRLARFYNLDGVQGDVFQAVSVPDGVTRGGLLTMSGMHLITSNGTRTSPVKRGAWILANVLGHPSPPPPPNVGDIKPGVPGIDKATVRQRLEIHRRDEKCAGCHDKIDPLGFALENFDAIGAWRTQEGTTLMGGPQLDDPIIDASGQLPDGRIINGVNELEDVLLENPKAFADCFVEKLTVYALGRGLRSDEFEWKDQMASEFMSKEYSIRNLIVEIVLSPAFLQK